MFTRADLARDFARLGVRPGDVVMMHASVRAVGQVAGGVDQIHLAIKDALTEDGTLMMYASCPAHVDEVGRGEHDPEFEREILEKLPAFDPYTARSARDNGALVEMLRTYPGSKVNAHPTRFVVWGRQADYLISEQPWDFAMGAGSALERLVTLDGKILMLGSDHDTVTFLHYAEHIVDIPDKRIVRFQVPIEEQGRRVWREMAEVDSSRGAHAHWTHRFFAELTDSYLMETGNTGGRVGNAQSYLFSARGLLEYALPLMRAIAADPAAARSLRELGGS
jgi:aminoglycoside 3-N-acetyltransferase